MGLEDPMILAPNAPRSDGASPPWTDSAKAICYGTFAQTIWITVGAVVGIAGPYLGSSLVGPAIGQDQSVGVGWSFLVLWTVPAVALLSGLAAAICLFSGVAFQQRIVVCGSVNALALLMLIVESSGSSEFVGQVLYGVFAEIVWVIVGGAVGFCGVLLGASTVGPFLRSTLTDKAPLRGGKDPGVALSFMPMVTVPAGALLSGVAASVCLLGGASFGTRLAVLLLVNGGYLVFLLCAASVPYL